MCGIIGINSYENVANKLVAGLKKLEYRGYDSAGIACIKDDSICTVKTSGKVGARYTYWQGKISYWSKKCIISALS